MKNPVYRFTINFKISLGRLLDKMHHKAEHFCSQWWSCVYGSEIKISNKHPNHTRKQGNVELESELIGHGQGLSSREALSQMKARNLRPATTKEMIACWTEQSGAIVKKTGKRLILIALDSVKVDDRGEFVATISEQTYADRRQFRLWMTALPESETNKNVVYLAVRNCSKSARSRRTEA
jgi:hypothetical protein